MAIAHWYQYITMEKETFPSAVIRSIHFTWFAKFWSSWTIVVRFYL